MFKTITENISAEMIEKKSKFISHLYYVESVGEAERLIKQIGKKYFDARHNCYAFRVMTENGIENRFSDDGEPSGTAGRTYVKHFDFSKFVQYFSDCNKIFWWDFTWHRWTC